MFSFSKSLIMISAAGLLLGGCGSASQTSETKEQPEKTQGQVEQKVTEPTTLSKMIATSQAGTCTITDATNATSTKIEITVKGKKVLMKNEATEKISYILADGEFSYMWDNGAKTGYKAKQAAASNSSVSDEERAKQFAPMDDASKYKLDCKPGSVDDQVFTPPADITFQFMGEK